MGPVKSNEMLLFSKKIYADEAFKVGLVTEVFPVSTFDSTVWAKLQDMSELPPQVIHIHFIFKILLQSFKIDFNVFFDSL